MHRCTTRFLILSISSVKQKVGLGMNDEVSFQDDDIYCHRSKSIKTLLQERLISSVIWPTNSSDLKLIYWIYGTNGEKKKGPWTGFIMHNWSVNCYRRTATGECWLIDSFFSSLNSSCHKSLRDTTLRRQHWLIFFPFMIPYFLLYVF